jgi:hypothetical protein
MTTLVWRTTHGVTMNHCSTGRVGRDAALHGWHKVLQVRTSARRAAVHGASALQYAGGHAAPSIHSAAHWQFVRHLAQLDGAFNYQHAPCSGYMF